tara:strand:- start:1426 stop:1881 length:456 start_codon:yes stop_codon:yes gene_type:complete
MKAVKKYSSGGKVKSGCGCGKAKCNCKSYAKGGIVSATGPSGPSGRSGVNYSAKSEASNAKKNCKANSSCGDSFEVGGFKSTAATTGSNKKRLSNVGSSREWTKNKRDEKKNARKAHRAVKKAARQENRAERQAEKEKKKRTYRYVSPRFM